ncbi:hypothetical protein KC906_03800, partial [Candidatus Kaiserbacteria bacterium]|nr:hypothetical protein [Candidatus Kaiserbacteria bacterium]
DVVGLPDGLTWDWTPDGIIIYNEDAEITPSEFLGYDIDSYTANFENQNDVTIDNNIYIDAITGRNEITNTVHGEVVTGDAYASANVMNIANTNVIGANWTMAIINVMGDFYGNVTFSQTDLKLTGGALGASDPLSPSDELFFTYTIANTSDKVATDVVLSQALVNAHVPGGTSALQEVSIGDLAPGSSVDVDLVAVVDGDLPDGTSTVKAVAVAESGEGDSNSDDNVITETFEALVPTVTDTDTSSTSSDQDTSTTTEDDNTEDDDATGETENDTTTPSVTNNDGGGGGGGGSSNTNSIKRDQKPIDPDTAPVIVVKKTSNVEDGGIVFAGETVEYKITVTNNGGTAYDAVVYDTLRNPIGAVLSEES